MGAADPGDPGVTIGAAWLFAHLAGAPRGAPMTPRVLLRRAAITRDIAAALEADDIASQRIGNISTPDGRDAVADLMAFMVAQSGIIALYQGAAETGPRALGHRSILANPCDPDARERLNERVKYREAIRPLAPMATLEAAHEYFDLLTGASDADYNAYNYMVLTARAKPQAREKIPAVIHADGTGRIQIVRAEDDPLTYAYLKALGRHIGVEISVNTSFNVAGRSRRPRNRRSIRCAAQGSGCRADGRERRQVYRRWHGGERDSGRFTRLAFGMESRTGSGLIASRLEPMAVNLIALKVVILRYVLMRFRSNSGRVITICVCAWLCGLLLGQSQAADLERLLKNSHVPGLAYAVIRDGKIVDLKAFGVRNSYIWESGRPEHGF